MQVCFTNRIQLITRIAFFLSGLLDAQYQAIYIPNYHQAFDSPKADETPSSFEQEENLNIPLNDTSDFPQSTTLSSIEFPSKITTLNESTEFISTTKRSLSQQNGNHTLNDTSLLSTESEYSHFHYREPIPPHEQINKTTDIPTRRTFSQNYTEFIVDSSNQTHLHGKNLANNQPFDIYNTTYEEAARYLTDRKLMQSLIHLLPPNLWSQIQNNRSIYHQNQTHYMKPLLPNPVLLAEAAAQAGLPGPGPYPIPEHLWPQNPLRVIPKLPTTCECNKNTYCFKINFYLLASTVRTTLSTRRTTLRPRPFLPIKSVPSSPLNKNEHSLFSQMGFTCPLGANDFRYPDRRLCNMYFTCTSSNLPEPNLCPEGYLFSDVSRDCEIASRVNCGTRLSAYFEPDETKSISTTTTTRSKINIFNGTIECILGADGYFEDPLYCNIYHHCIAGVDYIEPCPNQLAWNEKSKMCDW